MAVYALRTTNVPVTFDKLRKMWLTAPMQEGVANAGDLKVTQRAAGANMSVDVAPGAFWIKTDIDTPDGLVPGYSDAIGNFAVAAAHATLPRIDALYLQYNDSALGAGVGGDTPTFRLLTGTATAGAQATNFAGANYRAGAPTPPNDALLIADIPVPAAAASITNANIVDRRPWARGFYYPLIDAAGDIALGAAAAWTATSTTRHRLRVECSGAALRIHARVRHVFPATVGSEVDFAPLLDGAVPAVITTSTTQATTSFQAPTASNDLGFNWAWEIPAPTPGSHLIDLAYRNGVGFTLHASATLPLSLVVEEIVRQAANNGTA